MATNTRAELAVFDCNLRGGGLEEFEPEPETERGGMWLRVPSPTAADVQRWEPHVAPHRARVWPLAAPVVITAAIVGAAVPWLGLRTSDRSAPQPPRAVVSTEIPRVDSAGVAPAAAEPVTAPPAEPVTAPPPTVPASTTVPPSTAAPAPAAATTLTEPVRPPEDPALAQTLAPVSHAYRALDAAAVAAVLPNTDAAGLTQAFSELKYQTLSFDRCALRPNGAESAVASCDVSLVTAPKTGDAALQRHHEAWTLVLNRSGEGWRIAAVTRR